MADAIPSDVVESTPLLVGQVAVPLPWYRRPSPYWVLIGLFMINLATTFLTAPILQFVLAAVCEQYYDTHDHTNGTLFISITGLDQFANAFLATEERCKIPEVQQKATRVLQLNALCTHMFALGMITFWTSLSDRRGRRFSLVFPATAQIADMIILILLCAAEEEVRVCGVFVAPLARSVGAAYGLAGAIGPTLSAYIYERAGKSTVVIVYMSLTLFILWWLYVIFLLPESKQQLQPATNATTTSLKSVVHQLNVFAALGIVFANSTLPFMAIIHFLMNISDFAVVQIYLLYPSLKFGWGTWEDGIFLSLIYFESLVVLVILIPIIRRLFKKRGLEKVRRSSLSAHPPAPPLSPTERGIILVTNTTDDNLEQSINTEWTEIEAIVEEDTYTTDVANVSAVEPVVTGSVITEGSEPVNDHDNITSRRDSWMVVFGIFFKMLSFLSYGLAWDGTTYYESTTFYALATIYSPSIRSMLTTIVSPSQTGAILGAVTFLEVTAGFLAPLIYSTVYFATVQSQPNLVFLLLAGNMLIAITLAIIVALKERTKKNMRLGRALR
ncbi:hypothetical protein BC937DRAFT_91822 [Endogone sp. FLAS-F59071]|nr:hypothetical protein BC937DRAFT_91822 [Endogone sp. FLAS-F59071]|eukprot:RUS15908.1 hypothetical protein BC937DRAFT_91822 [Endogone sp. FLAS-F59071]